MARGARRPRRRWRCRCGRSRATSTGPCTGRVVHALRPPAQRAIPDGRRQQRHRHRRRRPRRRVRAVHEGVVAFAEPFTGLRQPRHRGSRQPGVLDVRPPGRDRRAGRRARVARGQAVGTVGAAHRRHARALLRIAHRRQARRSTTMAEETLNSPHMTTRTRFGDHPRHGTRPGVRGRRRPAGPHRPRATRPTRTCASSTMCSA